MAGGRLIHFSQYQAGPQEKHSASLLLSMKNFNEEVTNTCRSAQNKLNCRISYVIEVF